MTKRHRWSVGAALGSAIFCLSLLAVQPVPAAAFASCQAAGGPNGRCCACSDDDCIEVHHQGVNNCSSSSCSSVECEWLACRPSATHSGFSAGRALESPARPGPDVRGASEEGLA